MPELPRAAGQPSRAAAELIDRIIEYGIAPLCEDPDGNLARAADMLHIYNAAADALKVCWANVNEGPGNTGYRSLGQATGAHWTTVKRYVGEGRGIRAAWEAA
jgi:hypothetical protein